jgi:hypothetical protein
VILFKFNFHYIFSLSWASDFFSFPFHSHRGNFLAQTTAEDDDFLQYKCEEEGRAKEILCSLCVLLSQFLFEERRLGNRLEIECEKREKVFLFYLFLLIYWAADNWTKKTFLRVFIKWILIYLFK